jgi:hypothetical protein
MMPAVQRPSIDAAITERVLLHGDLRQLTPAQKVSYYSAVCESLGLNPLTQPFAYLVLNGKEILYAKRDAAEQLRKIHSISIEIKAREMIGDVYVVTAGASMGDGRRDESTGAVAIGTLKGESLANAYLKAETKAKRRVTLSICGLGILDETEVDSLDGPKGYVVEAADSRSTPVPASVAPAGHAVPAATSGMLGASVPNAPDSGISLPVEDDADLPAGYVLIRRVDVTHTRNKNIQKALITVSTGETYNTIDPRLTAQCEQFQQDGTPVLIGSDDFEENKHGLKLLAVHTLKAHNAALDAELVKREAAAAELARQAGEIA